MQLVDGAASLANPLEWAANPGANIARLKTTANGIETLGKLAALTNPTTAPAAWMADPQGNARLVGALWNSATTSFKNDPAKFTGNAVGTIGMMFIPGGGEAAVASDVGRGAVLLNDAGRVTEGLNIAADANKAKTLAETSRIVTEGQTIAKPAANAAGTVFSGHGGYEIGSGMAAVPEGTSLTVYSRFGSTITDRLGNAIETGQDLSKVYSRTYQAGERMPNYTLYPPEGLNLKGNPFTVSKPTRVSDLLQPNMGDCQWAACTYNWRSGNANTVYDTIGIGNKQTMKWVTIY